MLGLYIHIPFCTHLCPYCDFPKKIARDSTQVNNYIDRLLEEIDQYRNEFMNIDTIYIGGGTPNALDDYNLERLLAYLAHNIQNHIEFSIELNPELITLEQVNILKKYGVSRVSLGVQTFSNKFLALLGRKHTTKDVFDKVAILKQNGIYNINIDLIFGYEGQTFEDFRADLEIFKSLNVTHLSAYSLIIEEKTLFYKKYKDFDFDSDLLADMYEYLQKFCEDNDFKQYEVSNFAKEGFQSKHNLIYWNKDSYIGVGLGATGYINNLLTVNSSNIYKYIKKEDTNISITNQEDLEIEFIIMGLRKVEGISLDEYERRFKKVFLEQYDINDLLDKGLLVLDNNRLAIPKKYLFISNQIMLRFV